MVIVRMFFPHKDATFGPNVLLRKKIFEHLNPQFQKETEAFTYRYS